jgi:hypothetical protein
MIILLSWLAGVTVIQSILAVGSVSTAVGIFIALWTLHEAHEWNRRHYTIELLDKWNENARKHLEALEIEFPDLFAVPDFIARPEVKTTWCINRDRAKRLVKVSSESEEFTKNDMLIRGHLLAVLNYFEGIASAYEQHVVDRKAIFDSVGTVILDVCMFFEPFIQEMNNVSRRDPWPPLSHVVDLWLKDERLSKTLKQAADARLSYDETQKRHESYFKQRTGA